jgi:hypothetical protein
MRLWWFTARQTHKNIKIKRRMIMNNKIKEILDNMASKLEAIVKDPENLSERLERLFSLFGKISGTEDTSELLNNFINADTYETVFKENGLVNSFKVPLSENKYIEYIVYWRGAIGGVKVQLQKDIFIDTRNREICYDDNTDKYAVSIAADTANAVFEIVEFKSNEILNKAATEIFMKIFDTSNKLRH